MMVVTEENAHSKFVIINKLLFPPTSGFLLLLLFCFQWLLMINSPLYLLYIIIGLRTWTCYTYCRKAHLELLHVLTEAILGIIVITNVVLSRSLSIWNLNDCIDS